MGKRQRQPKYWEYKINAKQRNGLRKNGRKKAKSIVWRRQHTDSGKIYVSEHGNNKRFKNRWRNTTKNNTGNKAYFALSAIFR